MKPRRVTSTAAVRNFGDLLSEVKHGRKEFVITRGGESVARVIPSESQTLSLREFAEFWRTENCDAGFADDLEKVQMSDKPVEL